VSARRHPWRVFSFHDAQAKSGLEPIDRVRQLLVTQKLDEAIERHLRAAGRELDSRYAEMICAASLSVLSVIRWSKVIFAVDEMKEAANRGGLPSHRGRLNPAREASGLGRLVHPPVI
jgi:hypothetical protein